MLKFFSKLRTEEGEIHEITRAEALNKVLGTYRENDCVRDWLTIQNCIVCRYSIVYVIDTDANDGWDFDLLLLAGTQNPEDAEYDDNGNRI